MYQNRHLSKVAICTERANILIKVKFSWSGKWRDLENKDYELWARHSSVELWHCTAILMNRTTCYWKYCNTEQSRKKKEENSFHPPIDTETASHLSVWLTFIKLKNSTLSLTDMHFMYNIANCCVCYYVVGFDLFFISLFLNDRSFLHCCGRSWWETTFHFAQCMQNSGKRQ